MVLTRLTIVPETVANSLIFNRPLLWTTIVIYCGAIFIGNPGVRHLPPLVPFSYLEVQFRNFLRLYDRTRDKPMLGKFAERSEHICELYSLTRKFFFGVRHLPPQKHN